MKNIILLDRDGNALEYILKHRQDTIVVLVCEKKQKILQLIQDFSNRIIHIVDYNNLLEIQDVEHIDYNLIEKMKFAQIDIETMLHRIMLDNPLAKDIYHQHLSFFTKIFENYAIDFLFCSETNLTSPNHHIPFVISASLNIPCYYLDSYHYLATALIKHQNINKQEYVAYNQKTVYTKTKDIIFYKQVFHNKKEQGIKHIIRNFISKIFGEMFAQFIVCLFKMNFQQNRLGIQYSYWHKLYYFFKYKQLKKTYDKLSIIPNLKEKYIYYSIHLEPEAAIIGKTILESQLTIIKMLHAALPNGWKLYIKEHPHQFTFNNQDSHYFINNLNFFKNTNFYKEILKLKNATLVSLKISSKELLQNAQATSTCGGTISLESATYNIPTILFNPSASIYSLLENALHVTSYQDLKDAIKKIESNFLKDKKINLDKLNSYLANPQDKDFYQNLFLTIENHIANNLITKVTDKQ